MGLAVFTFRAPVASFPGLSSVPDHKAFEEKIFYNFTHVKV